MRIAGYLAAGFLIAILLGGMAAHAPARLKLLGLFPIGLGLLTGGLLGWAASEIRLIGTRATLLLMGLCIFAGQMAVTAEAYRLNINFWNDHFRSIPLGFSLPDFTPKQIAEMTPESREVTEQITRAIEQRRELRSFSGWLKQRLPASFGDWPAAAFYAWWIAETLCATIAGAFLGSRVVAYRGATASSPTTSTLAR